MSETTPAIRSVVVEREIAAPPDKLWRALTQPHLIAEWLMPNDFQPVAGHRFTLHREPRPEVKVIIDCEVLEVEPHKTLTYTWQAFGLDSVVTWTLTPTPNGTRLTMVQTGFRPDQETAYRGASVAWRQFFGSLEQLLARLD
jgi:uncharacterized protein YndB with AHSA1/START domain